MNRSFKKIELDRTSNLKVRRQTLPWLTPAPAPCLQEYEYDDGFRGAPEESDDHEARIGLSEEESERGSGPGSLRLHSITIPLLPPPRPHPLPRPWHGRLNSTLACSRSWSSRTAPLASAQPPARPRPSLALARSPLPPHPPLPPPSCHRRPARPKLTTRRGGTCAAHHAARAAGREGRRGARRGRACRGARQGERGYEAGGSVQPYVPVAAPDAPPSGGQWQQSRGRPGGSTAQQRQHAPAGELGSPGRETHVQGTRRRMVGLDSLVPPPSFRTLGLLT